MTQLRLLAALSFLWVCACSNTEPNAALTRISPARASRWFATSMTLTGERLFDDVRVPLDSSRAPSRSMQWKIQIDDDLTVEEVRHPDPQTLRFTVPEGLEPGNHSLIAISPAGQKVPFKAGLTVGEGVSGLVLSIESAADGAGEVIADRSLVAGEALELYAVFRKSDGAFATSDVGVTWSAADLPDALASSSGAATKFRSESLGETIVAATHEETDPAQTGSLRVISGDATLVSIEDAPGGAGHALSSQSLSIDQSLTFYAVSRDAFGNFVADIDADWHADDALQAASKAAAPSFEYAPTHPGMGKLYAEASLGTATVTITATAGRATKLSIVPATATLKSGADPQQFSLEAFDAQGNNTSDIGSITWSVASGPITELDQSGVLTPARAGTGVIRAVSSYELTATSGNITILPGAATALSFASATPLDLTAGDPAVQLALEGTDAAGNTTTDLGAITWAIVSGDITSIDPATGLLSPTHAGTGVIRATVNGTTVESAPITIHAGPAASLTIKPNLAALSADAAPLQFTATGVDAYGNATSPGTLTWSIASGPISAIGASTGLLDPKLAGSGKIKVVNGSGITAQSGTITINPGRVAQLAVQPSTLTTMLGDPASVFTATGTDADGNTTTDIGTLTWSIASGAIATLDGATGSLDPTSSGSGTIQVTSSYGAGGVSGNIVVQTYVSPVSVSAMRVSSGWWPGSQKERIEVDVLNAGARDAWVTGIWSSFARFGVDVSSQYSVAASYAILDRIPPQTTVTFTLYADVVAGSPSTGTIDATATVETFHPTLFVGAQTSKTASFTMSGSGAGQVNVSAPTFPNNRVCSGATVPFSASTSGVIAPDFDWRFPRSSASTNSSANVTATYAQPGNTPYSVLITSSFGYTTGTLAPLPIFTGEVTPDPSLAYPTGWLVFASPTNNESIDMAGLPDTNRLGMSGVANARILQCDGTRIPATGQRYLTFFVDRGTIPLALDQRPDLPGIQRLLTDNADTFPAFTLDNDSTGLEGSAMVYAEFWNPQQQAVTFAGLQPFRMNGDKVRPKVLNTLPAADCAAACNNKIQPVLFRFSEPMDATTISNVTVQRLNAASCGAAVAASLASTVTYDPPTRTLRVVPSSAPFGSYGIKITIPMSVKDSAANDVQTMSRCVIVSALAAATATATPDVVGPTPLTFSPDGDGTGETTSWNVTVDAQARWFELRIRHSTTEVWGETVFVSGAGGNTVAWDGRDYTGRVVPNGYYRVDVTAYNADGVASAKQTGVVEVASAIHFVGVLRRL